jgi:hypothetical protein
MQLRDFCLAGGIMADVTPTKMIHHPEPAKSEQMHQQALEEQTGPSGPEAQQSQAGSSGQPAAPGRKPLFRR